MLASLLGLTGIVKLLIANGAHVNQVDFIDSKTALYGYFTTNAINQIS